MADRLIRINDYVSVKASQVEFVSTAEFNDAVKVHLLSGEVHDLKYYSGGKFAAKDKFVQQVNDALAGD
jgi:hypothetical protein